ncbi:MAG TPA: hypothetical protein IAC14_14155 [Candidatus Scybalomonas excrementigallinarum]|nr:hypothetical protein [Candidatus Scybalomonas excrementigallinarum]
MGGISEQLGLYIALIWIEISIELGLILSTIQYGMGEYNVYIILVFIMIALFLLFLIKRHYKLYKICRQKANQEEEEYRKKYKSKEEEEHE